MDERWWPGLREHLTVAAKEERDDETDRSLGIPVFLTGHTDAPGQVHAAVGTIVGLIAIVLLSVLDYTGGRGITIVVGSVLASLAVVEGWYRFGTRKLGAGDADLEGHGE